MDEIADLIEAAYGHALVLFTFYAAMSAVKERLAEQGLIWPLFTMGRNAVHITEQFKSQPGSILLATGAAWEGFDFPGGSDTGNADQTETGLRSGHPHRNRHLCCGNSG